MISQVSGFPKCSSTCPQVTELEKENKELKEKLAGRDEKIKRLWKKLRRYHNPHTPSSKKLGSSESKSSKSKSQRNKLGERDSGRREDHEGVTRSQAEPDRTIIVEEENCSHCGAKLGESERTETRVIEDIADPQPVEVTEYEIDHYECDSCGEEVVAGHEDLPPEGGSAIMRWFRRPSTSIAEGPFTGGLETS